MNQSLTKLKNLNALKGGLTKQWIWGDKANYFKSCDILQKVNYCIQDLNREIDSLSEFHMKEIIYIIVLVDWIREAVDALSKVLISGLNKDFVFAKEEELTKATEYFKAIRSFVVAHPLMTNRHAKYGFDGDKICIDISCQTSQAAKFNSDHWYKIDFDGLKKTNPDAFSDFVLYMYSRKIDGMEFFQYIKANICDLIRVAELNIEKLYAMDKYLNKLRKKEWI